MTEELQVLTIEDDLDPNLCAAITSRGTQCKNKPLPGSMYCQIEAHQALEEPEETGELCGHINRHSYGVNGKLDNLSCEKEKGHEGNHGAWHFERHYGPALQDDINPRIYHPQLSWEGDRWTEWNDDAGTPVELIKPKPLPRKPGIMDNYVASDDFWADEHLP